MAAAQFAAPARAAIVAERGGAAGLSRRPGRRHRRRRAGLRAGNLAILPDKLAADFHRFCQRNPKPCPIIGMSEVGDPRIPALGLDLDVRTTCRATASGATASWSRSPPTSWRIARRSRRLRHRLLVFLRGSADGGRLGIRHIEERRNVPMYRTNVACAAAGPFAGRWWCRCGVHSGGGDPRHPDHQPLSVRTWRARAYRRPGLDWHCRHQQARLRRRRDHPRRRGAGVLGVRGDPAIGHPALAAGFRDHPRPGAHAGHRRPQLNVLEPVIFTCRPPF